MQHQPGFPIARLDHILYRDQLWEPATFTTTVRSAVRDRVGVRRLDRFIRQRSANDTHSLVRGGA